MEFSWFLRFVTFVALFSIDFLGTMSARGDNGVRVTTFFEKRAHFHALAIKYFSACRPSLLGISIESP